VSYLAGRRLSLRDLKHPAHDLRLAQDLKKFRGDEFGPAMIAPIMSAAGVRGVHATWLHYSDKTGFWFRYKRDGEKQMLGEARGGFVPISHGEHGLTCSAARKAGKRTPLVLAEGIETSLALALALPECRVWACLSLGGIGAAPVHLADAGSILVALENDIKPAALKAREGVIGRLEEQAEAMGVPLATMEPSTGSDFADVMAAGKNSEVLADVARGVRDAA
jgi:hypothetical protein